MSGIELYTYYERPGHELRQSMNGSWKSTLKHITRGDITAPTPETARVSGILLVSDLDTADAEGIPS